ncbi:MAG: AAA family ATPase [Candidatus Binataceae bacterium]
MAVYESYYHCLREPFSLSPDPSFLYAAEPHREALAQLRYLVQERKGFAVVTGEVGTGKTMLLRTLIESVGPKVQTGYIFNPPRTIHALYDSIGEEFGVTLNGAANPAAVLNRHFLSVFQAGGTVVMIFDEAQSLSIELLEEIRLLTNIETSSAKLAQVILAGQPEFDAMLDSTELRALRQRLVFRYSLAALNPSDTVRYIAARLGAAGAKRSPFTLKACVAVHRYSGGVPRLVNVICDNAMLTGFATESLMIDEQHVTAAAADLRLTNTPNRTYERKSAPDRESVIPRSAHRRSYYILMACLTAVLAIAAIFFAIRLNNSNYTPLSQFQGMFENTLRRLGGSANSLINYGTSSIISRV